MPLHRTCKQVTALVIAREDRALPLPDRIALRIHMKLCDTCPVFERQILTMRNAMRQWRAYQASDAEE
ncbi:MAG: zf-HC2 domain-containing protein [Rhodoferax sp.]|nr:zf-HC2 domain-containing protein [Rhodoferax sp.]MCF8208785.1 zf-HC2 domain-containing protein [Rhodoferax sp.]